METTYQFNRRASVDSKITNAMTQQHLDTINKLCPVEASPELFSDDANHVDVLVFKGREIVSLSDITNDTEMNPRTQNARVGGSVTKADYEKLKRGFNSTGVDLTQQSPIVFRNTLGQMKYITGHTRHEVFGEYNFSDIVVNVFEPAPNATDTKLQDRLSFFGVSSNPERAPYTPASMPDITAEIERALINKWITTLEEAKERALRYTSSGLSKSKLESCALTAFSAQQSNPMDKKIPMWDKDSSAWLEKHNYKDIKGKVKYFAKSYDFPSKGLVDCSIYAAKNPKEEVRIAVHAGVCGDEDTYTSRIKGFFIEYHSILDAFQKVHFGGADQIPNNIRLYGSIPQIGSLHNLDKICLFDNIKCDGSVYQK